MSDQVARALDGLSRREHFIGANDLVFCNEVGGFVDDGRLRTRFYAALKEAGLGHLREKEDPVVFHDLRHTFGTLAVRAFPLSDVKAFMGHESISTTMIYVHHVPQTDAAAKLSKLLSTESTPDLLSPAAQLGRGLTMAKKYRDVVRALNRAGWESVRTPWQSRGLATPWMAARSWFRLAARPIASVPAGTLASIRRATGLRRSSMTDFPVIYEQARRRQLERARRRHACVLRRRHARRSGRVDPRSHRALPRGWRAPSSHSEVGTVTV